MKSAYIARLNLGDEHLLGVAAKIRGQMKALSRVVGDMDLYFLRDNEIRRNDVLLKRFGTGRLGRMLAYRLFFYPWLAHRLSPHDYIYIRYQGSSLLFLYLLWRLKARNPKIQIHLEIPSFPYDTEYAGLRDHMLGLVDRLFRRHLHHHVDRVVTFSRQACIFGIPAICTDNGVAVDTVPMMESPPEPGCFCLLGVANLAFWHGYDRVIRGLAAYYAQGGQQEVRFLVVGSGKEREHLQRLARNTGMSEKVSFLGALHGKALDQVFARSRLGISSLGMHRLTVDTTSLKSREYCARGLPFVTDHEDPDFTAGFPFLYQAPASDEPLDIASLLAFLDGVEAMPHFRQKMRCYAEQHLGWNTKMQPVIDALAKAGCLPPGEGD